MPEAKNPFAGYADYSLKSIYPIQTHKGMVIADRLKCRKRI
jgi:hypothetical protein